MKETSIIKRLKLTDPDSYQEMCEAAAMTKQEVKATLRELGLEQVKTLPVELARLLNPSLSRRFILRLGLLASSLQKCVASFFLLPARPLIGCLVLISLLGGPVFYGVSSHGAHAAVARKRSANKKECFKIVDVRKGETLWVVRLGFEGGRLGFCSE